MASSTASDLAFALIGVTVLIFYATVWSSHGELAAAWIYSIGLVLTLGISFSYNVWPVSRTKWFLRRLDHSSIFILIAATYTPFLERGADNPLLFGMLVGIWAHCGARHLPQMRLSGPLRQARHPALSRDGLERRLGGRGPWPRAFPIASMLLIVDRRHHLFAGRHLPRLGKAALPECHLARLRRGRRRRALFGGAHLLEGMGTLPSDY